MKPKVHLVLGSGGARGIAHIAVIEELEQEGFEIIEVIGCSMGAMIGGIYAAGQLPEYKKWLLSLTRREVFDLMDFTFTKQGFVKGEKIFDKHKEMTGALNIEDFNIPFTAVATDIKHNNEVHYTSGDLYKALRASVAIPGFILPVVQEGNVLVDGGVLNPLPVDLVKKEDGAIVVAVNLNAKVNPDFEVKQQQKEKTDIQIWMEDFLELGEKKKEPSYSVFELMEITFKLTQDRLTSLMLELYKPDILVEIPRNTANTFEYDQAKRIYKRGEKAIKESLKTHREKASPKG